MWFDNGFPQLLQGVLGRVRILLCFAILLTEVFQVTELLEGAKCYYTECNLVSESFCGWPFVIWDFPKLQGKRYKNILQPVSHSVVTINGKTCSLKYCYFSKSGCTYHKQWTVTKGSTFRFVFQLKIYL